MVTVSIDCQCVSHIFFQLLIAINFESKMKSASVVSSASSIEFGWGGGADNSDWCTQNPWVGESLPCLDQPEVPFERAGDKSALESGQPSFARPHHGYTEDHVALARADPDVPEEHVIEDEGCCAK